MDIAQVDGTSELPLASMRKKIADAQRTTVDLNEAPFKMKEEHLNRLRALSRTGKDIFSYILHQILILYVSRFFYIDLCTVSIWNMSLFWFLLYLILFFLLGGEVWQEGYKKAIFSLYERYKWTRAISGSKFSLQCYCVLTVVKQSHFILPPSPPPNFFFFWYIKHLDFWMLCFKVLHEIRL